MLNIPPREACSLPPSSSQVVGGPAAASLPRPDPGPTADHILPRGLGATADVAAFAQRPSAILVAAGHDLRGAADALVRQGERAGLPSDHRYFVLVGRLADELAAGRATIETAGLALDTLLGLAAALQHLAADARPFTPDSTQLARLVDSIGTGIHHAALANTVHGAVRSYLAQGTADSAKPLLRYLHPPVMNDRVMAALCSAAQAMGAPLTDADIAALGFAALGDSAENTHLRMHATGVLQRYLDGSGEEPAWSAVMDEARQVLAAEEEERDGGNSVDQEKAMTRPHYHGLEVRLSYNASGGLVGPTPELVDRLPTAAQVARLASEIMPGDPHPLRHMSRLDLRPFRTEILYRRHPLFPTQVQPVVTHYFHDPACTRLENALRYLTAARLLDMPPTDARGWRHQATFDAARGTISYPASSYGRSNDLAFSLPGSPDDRDFLDEAMFRYGSRHNADRFYPPAFSEPTLIDQGPHASAAHVAELGHIAATVVPSEGASQRFQFALRMQLPAHATLEDTERLRQRLGLLVGDHLASRNGFYKSSVAVVIAPGSAGGPGCYVTADGKPALRCVGIVTRRQLEGVLQDIGLAGHMDVEWDEHNMAWTAITREVAAAPMVRSLPMVGTRDQVPLAVREGLPLAQAYVTSPEARAAAAADPELAALLPRFASALSRVERAAAPGGTLDAVQRAAMPLSGLHRDVEERLSRTTPNSSEHRLLTALFEHSSLILPLWERSSALMTASALLLE